jgi:hypothetical protein
MTSESDSILDDLFHGCALFVFVEQASLAGGWPSAGATRRWAHELYESALAEKCKPATAYATLS